MQNLKERAMRSYGLYRFAGIATLAVAIGALCAAPSFARHHDNKNAVAQTASETTTSVSSNGVMQTTVSSASTGIDYSVLADQDIDHFSIKRAQAFGMNDEQIAQVAKLAHVAMVPMSQVLDRIEDGRTIAGLAIDYGVPINTVMDCSDWQTRISDYMTAYNNTGMGALRHGSEQPTVSSYTTSTVNNGMATGPAIMPNGTTVAPNGTTITPNGTTITPNGTTVTPNGTTITPNGTTVSPGGTTTTPSGTTVTPDGTTTTPSGTTVTPGGATIAPSGTVTNP